LNAHAFQHRKPTNLTVILIKDALQSIKAELGYVADICTINDVLDIIRKSDLSKYNASAAFL
jgi:hypothetical protein